MRIMMRIDGYLCRRFLAYKLGRICKAIGIKPYPWQRDYALGKTWNFGGGLGRATGKTMAVMLRILITSDNEICSSALAIDPDYKADDIKRRQWYVSEYRRLARMCALAKIRVPVLFVPQKRQEGYR